MARRTLPVIGPDEPVLIADRIPGQVTMRRTSTRGRYITAQCPCHPQEIVTFPAGPATLTVVCRTCLLAFTAVLRHPPGKPPLAQFTQKAQLITLTGRAR